MCGCRVDRTCKRHKEPVAFPSARNLGVRTPIGRPMSTLLSRRPDLADMGWFGVRAAAAFAESA